MSRFNHYALRKRLPSIAVTIAFAPLVLAGCAVQSHQSNVGAQYVHPVARLEVVYVPDNDLKFEVENWHGRNSANQIDMKDMESRVARSSEELRSAMASELPNLMKSANIEHAFTIEATKLKEARDWQAYISRARWQNSDVMVIRPVKASLVCVQGGPISGPTKCNVRTYLLTTLQDRKTGNMMWSSTTSVRIDGMPLSPPPAEQIREYWGVTQDQLKSAHIL